MKHLTLKIEPFVGLRPFTEKETLLFFGRDAHVHDLLAKLGTDDFPGHHQRRQRFVAVLGASGTGKSSLVRAGLIPALHRGGLTGAELRWNVCIFKPGDAPLMNLAIALAKDERWVDHDDSATAVSSLSSSLASSPLALAELYLRRSNTLKGQALLLVVDQFEEIFRFRQRNMDHAEAFIQLLLRSSVEDVPIYIVMTMRSDFLGNCVAFQGLPEAINKGIYLTPQLDVEQLRAVIASPLMLAGGEIDPALVSRLINTLGDEDELPVLEHALLRMWNRAGEHGRIRIEDHDFEVVCAADADASMKDAGAKIAPKLAFAIDNHASEIFHLLSIDCQRVARQVFLALVERREGKIVRRPLLLRELYAYAGPQQASQVRTVIAAFRAEGAGFLLPSGRECESLSDDTLIDISHESLFRQWRQFQAWLEDERKDVLELGEWMQRATRHLEIGGLLDELDCAGAERWRERVGRNGVPTVWAARYAGNASFVAVDKYIRDSRDALTKSALKQAELVQKAQQAEVLRAEAERARLENEVVTQKLAAQQAEAEQHRAEAARQAAEADRQLAEQEKRTAQRLAAVSRRHTAWAVVACFVVVAFAVYGFLNAREASDAKRKATASEIAANAENLAPNDPDLSLLLAIAAEDLDQDPRAEALFRWAEGNLNYDNALRGHQMAVTAVRFSPKGKVLASAGYDRTIRVWDETTRHELKKMTGHLDTIYSVEFSPDGERLVSASEDGTARVWDVKTGDCVLILRGHKGAVYSARFSPNGKFIATSGSSPDDMTARLWDASTGQLKQVLTGHEGPVLDAVFSPDNSMLATGSTDSTVRIWKLNGVDPVIVLPSGTRDKGTNIEFSPNSAMLATGAQGKGVHLWDTSRGGEMVADSTFDHCSKSSQVHFSPNGAVLASICQEDKVIRVWKIGTTEEPKVLSGHDGDIYFFTFSPDGKTIASGGMDKTARLWDVSSGKALQVMRGHGGMVFWVDFPPVNSKLLATASEDGTVRLWRAKSSEGPQVIRGDPGGIDIAQLSNDGNTLATTDGRENHKQTVSIWDLRSGIYVQVMSENGANIADMRLSPDAHTVATLVSDTEVHLWNAAAGRTFLRLTSASKILAMDFSHDSKLVAIGEQAGMTQLWDVQTGQKKGLPVQQGSAVTGVTFSPDGKTLATGGANKSYLWNVKTSQLLHELSGHSNNVTGLVFSNNGKTLATASNATSAADSTVLLWNVASGKRLQSLSGHEGGVTSMVFSHDGKLLASASSNTFSQQSAAYLWQVDSGRELQVLRTSLKSVNDLAFSPDGSTLVTAIDDNTTRLWDTRSGKELQVLRGHDQPVKMARFIGDGKTVMTVSEDGTARLWNCEACAPVPEVVRKFRTLVGRELTDDERRRFGLPVSSDSSSNGPK